VDILDIHSVSVVLMYCTEMDRPAFYEKESNVFHLGQAEYACEPMAKREVGY
jgi:hypothetical protein